MPSLIVLISPPIGITRPRETTPPGGYLKQNSNKSCNLSPGAVRYHPISRAHPERYNRGNPIDSSRRVCCWAKIRYSLQENYSSTSPRCGAIVKGARIKPQRSMTVVELWGNSELTLRYSRQRASQVCTNLFIYLSLMLFLCLFLIN